MAVDRPEGVVREGPGTSAGAIGMDTNVIIEGSRSPMRARAATRPSTGKPLHRTIFKAMDLRLLQGRLFDDRDTATSPPVVVIGQSLARPQLWFEPMEY